ncbi:MAG: response regulator [Roseburia sp.]|nr:response regulator [Anaeroplasma bactoclasticum]MCM1196244.1 response regulator [Roseburia sp.]MCM1557152.1 response regulator [Anaeroplasma bactoclasticum]
MKIIVVDDEIIALTDFLVEVVNDIKIEYKFFLDNPLDTINYVKDNEVSGAFLDINMPKINGVELAKKLVLASPKLKIVFITAYTHDEKAICQLLKDNLLGFCYKPFLAYDINCYIEQMYASQADYKIKVVTFGPFEVFLQHNVVRFSSFKSKELLALLIIYNGKSLTMSDAICHLWPDKPLDLAKRLYRDAVWRLRKTLKDYHIEEMVEFKRALLLLNKRNIVCDYWEHLEKRNQAYFGQFLPSYDWSIEYQRNLDEN